MLSFTFTSEDLKSVNANKSEENKVFIQLENARVVHTLMNPDGTPNWGQVEQDFMQDVTRGVPVIFKNGDKSQIILNTDNIGSDKERVKPLVTQRVQSLRQKGLSGQQLNDFKFMTNQANIGSIAGDFVIYFNTQDIFQDAGKRAQYIQNVGGGLVQLEISKVPPDNQEHLTYKTATRITFDKDKNKCHYSGYGMCASYEIASKDSMIIIAEVDLGPLGSENYTPKTSCSILADGERAEQILEQIKSDIPIPKNPQSKSYKEIEAAYKEIAVKTLQDTGYEKQFKETVKSDIELILSHSRLSDNPASHRSKLGAIKEFKSTPKLFAEVLVDKIDEALAKSDPHQQAKALQNLSKNTADFFSKSEEYSQAIIYDISRKLAYDTAQTFNKEALTQKFVGFANATEKQQQQVIEEHKTIIRLDTDFILSSEANQSKRNIMTLRHFDSTPEVFAEVLVENIWRINALTDPKQRSQAMKQLSDNAANFLDQPKGYISILVNDTVKEMAKDQNINLPKEGIISKISRNIGLMLAKINVKIHGKSSDLKEQKQLIHAARNKHHSYTGPTR